jgi:tetraacyldisaccharide 4'-kinase
MSGREPSWWYSDTLGWQTRALAPVAAAYAAVTRRRVYNATPFRARVPVICVGNFTAGGTGKTPTALLVADIVEGLGFSPWFLSRGYGGRLDGQEQVDPQLHTAAEVGDEPLLLAARAPTVTSRNRALGAEFIARRAPANAVIIMDDGLQNPSLSKALSIAVVDGARGIGNGRVIPAGPLRGPIDFQIARTDLILFNGRETTRARADIVNMADDHLVPMIAAHPVPKGDVQWLRNSKVVAFAGIANPSRFFALVESLGATIVERFEFGDHETLSAAHASRLLDAANVHAARLVTTEKDFVRLTGLDGARAEVLAKVTPIAITLSMGDDDRALLTEAIEKALSRAR